MRKIDPDHWPNYWTRCGEHNIKFHASLWCPECGPDGDFEEINDEETEEELDSEEEQEQQRRDEKNGLYPDKWDDCN